MEFGSVNAARTAAGLASIREEGIPPSRIIPEIKKRHAKRLSLAYTHAPRLLVSAAVARFGSWQSALEAAGLEYAEHRLKVKRHSDEHLIGWLRALAKAQPTLTLVEFMKTRCNAREN